MSLDFCCCFSYYRLFYDKDFYCAAQKLRAAASEVQKGNFDARADIKTEDEIGELGSAFNSMAQNLDLLFTENVQHLQELVVLNEIANATNRSLTLEIMLDRVLNAIPKP